jgi:tetratricopeptide (TPR) repeat protein/DNA-binding winged helix-turn-helix (wHTH) protein
MDTPEKSVYRLEDIEINPVRGCLKRGDQEDYLRQQTFEVLLYLVKQRQRLVSKDELIEVVWRGTAVTDNALAQCIVEIRKALGDDSRQPRFVKTIPKFGYRFIGPVEEHTRNGAIGPRMENDLRSDSRTTDGSTPVSPEGCADASAPEPEIPPAATKFPPKRTFASTVAGAVVLLAAVFVIWWHQPDVQAGETILKQLPGKKSLAIMYFDNQSPRPDMNWLSAGLADMLIADLSRSEKLNVLSREQLYSLLKRSGNTKRSIGLGEALEIARKSHAEAVVLGSFAAVEQRVRIDAQLYRSHDGQLLATDHVIAENAAQTLSQVDVLAAKLASRLAVVATPKSSIGEVMTDNLEAYRCYSLAVEEARAFRNEQAIKLLQKAIELDPRFAMAYARMGYTYAVSDFVPETGRAFLERAFQLSNRLTPLDRLYIAAWYEIARRDYGSAIRTFHQIIAEYPLEIEAYSRLGRLYHGEEESQKAIDVLKEGLAVDPEAKELYNALGIVYMSEGEYSEAVAAHERYVELAFQEPNSHDSLGMTFQRFGHYDQALNEYKKALSLDPAFEPSIVHLGDTYFQMGRYQEAIHAYEKYVHSAHSDLARSLGYGNIAGIYFRKGDIRRAELAAAQEMKNEKTAVWNAMLIALQKKDRKKLEKLRQVLFENLPFPERGTRSSLRGQDYFRGYIEWQSGNSSAALPDFKEAIRHLPPTSGMDIWEDCLANAYLEGGQMDPAISEYERILKINPEYPLLHYHLAEAYQRKGQRDQAKAFYQQFLQDWKNADSDLPEIVRAKTELQRL